MQDRNKKQKFELIQFLQQRCYIENFEKILSNNKEECHVTSLTLNLILLILFKYLQIITESSNAHCLLITINSTGVINNN
jgi:uncharacterized Rmd1/YagE family protein